VERERERKQREREREKERDFHQFLCFPADSFIHHLPPLPKLYVMKRKESKLTTSDGMRCEMLFVPDAIKIEKC
jgi:hypothetical protein